ncbi:MAG TPA: copper resistance protein CopC [Geminicoccaceae bacterium]|nr:copper resistance protein CopC [Geminicoccaceae bacterium]
MLERSQPAAGAVVPTDRAPDSISLWFSEPVGTTANAIAVLNGDNRRVDQLNAAVSAQEPSRVDVDLSDLAQGTYLVRWRVTSADGHVVRGSYWFSVGFAATPPPAAELLGTGAPRLSFLEIAARWFGLLALLCLAGAALFRVTVLDPASLTAPPFERAALLCVMGVFLVAHCLSAAAQAEAVAELPVPQALTAPVLGEVLLSSRFAVLWWLRLLFGVTLGALLYRQSRPKLAALTGLLLLITISLGSHAVGARAAPALAVAVDTLHLAAAALWLGTLLELCLLLPTLTLAREPRFAILRVLVPRVSAVLLPTVLILLATGIFNAWEQVATFQALFGTAHGQSLLLKLALLVPLLVIAAINLLFVRPRIAAAATGKVPRLFLANVRAEATLAALLLLPVAVLAALPPSAQQAFPEPLEIARQAGDLRVAFRVEPVWVGVSRFQVNLFDEQGAAPADVRQVVLTFTMEGMNMGRTNVTMTPRGDGLYEAEGFYIGMPGIAQIGVAINRDGADGQTAVFRVEVPDLNPQQFAGLGALLGIDGVLSGATGERVRTDSASLAHGRELYEEHCVTCHGETGTGNGPAAPSLLPPPADLTLHARWHSGEQLDWFIANGVQGTAMVAFGDELDAAQRWDVISHLHALASAPTATALRPAPVAGSQLAAAPPPGKAASPAPGEAASLTGRLVFGPDFDNNLWLLQLPDGKPKLLTQLGPKEFSSNPAWSPDGRQIAFSYYRLPESSKFPVPDGTDLYLMNADGNSVRPLLLHDASGAALQYPAWAADGSAVYVNYTAPAGAARRIDRVAVPSGERTSVVPNASFPALSPDGRWLAYVQYALPSERGESLWLSAPDGSRPREVLGPAVFPKYFGLRFSPDSRRLIFAAVGQPQGTRRSSIEPLRWLFDHVFSIPHAYADGDLWDLWIVDLDGSNLEPLTALSEDLPVAAWSPEGKHIAFLGGGSASSAEAGITVIDPDRKGLRRLTTQPGHRGLDWTSPSPTTPPDRAAR